MSREHVLLGSDHLLASDRLSGQRIGLVCNPASVNGSFHHTLDQVAASADITLAAVFGPQHGFHAVAQDNMVETPHGRHPAYGVPVYSLYSDTREPTADMLAELDLLVIDLQDVGTRVYTYAYTMANCLRGAQRRGLPVVVCDRPNPIGGLALEGPVLQTGFESFIGQFPIPLRHGMTIGELARLFNTHFGIGAELDVVPMTGWSRPMFFDETDLPWIMPSPNLPTLDSAIVYPGAVLLEGTTLSEGRGTTRPFELIGAPDLDSDVLTSVLTALELPGIVFRSVHFEPTFQKHAGRLCGGCQLHVVDRHAFEPVVAAVAIMQAAHELAPEAFGWREPPYEYEAHTLPIDILSGSDGLRRQIEAGESPTAIRASWEDGLIEFASIRRRYLAYE